MSYVASDYVIIKDTGQRAMVLEVDEYALLLQPLTRNPQGYGKQVSLPQVFKRVNHVRLTLTGETP